MSDGNGKTCCGPGYASPEEAMKADREKLLYTTALYVGTGIEKPDYLATVDVDPDSPTYSQVVARTDMGEVGDELHHSGWNACSSCNDDATKERRYILLPGVRTSNINVVDTADPRNPRLHTVISGDEIKKKTNLSAPHTVHCLGADIIISMLGDADGNAPGGFLHLNEKFEIVGRWENDIAGMNYNYDFWYQPRHNMMVSSEWGAPNTFMPGFDLDDVAKGKYGRSIHFWDFKGKKIEQSFDLGEEGMIPLEVRFHHN
ncbi:MAG: selenium-binding protein SBP56-related protein, partial [Pseudomonadota bacterium]